MPQLCTDPAMHRLSLAMAYQVAGLTPVLGPVAAACSVPASALGWPHWREGDTPRLSLPDKPWPSVCMGDLEGLGCLGTTPRLLLAAFPARSRKVIKGKPSRT